VPKSRELSILPPWRSVCALAPTLQRAQIPRRTRRPATHQPRPQRIEAGHLGAGRPRRLPSSRSVTVNHLHLRMGLPSAGTGNTRSQGRQRAPRLRPVCAPTLRTGDYRTTVVDAPAPHLATTASRERLSHAAIRPRDTQRGDGTTTREARLPAGFKTGRSKTSRKGEDGRPNMPVLVLRERSGAGVEPTDRWVTSACRF
jgi:hypothetical protein